MDTWTHGWMDGQIVKYMASARIRDVYEIETPKSLKKLKKRYELNFLLSSACFT